MARRNLTLRHRRLATMLRQLRERDGRSVAEIAGILGWNPSTLHRILGGEGNLPKITNVEAILDVYGLAAGPEREHILALVCEARQRGWWHPHKDVLSTGYESYIAFEAEAITLRCFENFVLPGLLQTPDYTRALIASRAPDRTPEQVEKLVTVRTERQRILTGAGGLRKLWIILDEAVLHRQFGQPQVMIEQLECLRKAADAPERYEPQVGIQILPFTAAQQPASGPFTLMTFGNPLDEEVVYLETAGGQAWMEETGEVNKVRVAWERLVAAARPVRDTLPIVETVMATMK